MRIPSTPIIAIACVVLSARSEAQTPYGTGTAGAGGYTPTLTCTQPYMGNGGFSLNVNSALGGAPAWLAVSLAPAAGMFAGANLLVDLTPAQLFLVQAQLLGGPVGVPGAGYWSLPYPLSMPANPALAGLTLYAQVGIDEGNGSWAATSGLAITLTMPQKLIIGTSAGGGPDPFYAIDPTTNPPTLLPISGPNLNNNCMGSEFAHDGRRAYVSQVFGNAVRELNFDVSPPTWGTLYNASGATAGIGVDTANDLTYTIETDASLNQELIVIDSSLSSPTYGTRLASTTGLRASVGYMERWALSPDGKLAAILMATTRMLAFVNTDVSSPAYLTWTFSTFNPTSLSGFALGFGCDFTPDGNQVLVVIDNGSATELARYDLVAGTWIDHNPGMSGTGPAGAIQHIGPQSSPPVTLPNGFWEVKVAPDGTFAIMTGWNSGTIAKLNLTPSNPVAWSITPVNSPVPIGGSSNGAWCCAVSSDSTQFATCANGSLLIFDAYLGTLVSQLALPFTTNVRDVTWQ